MGHINWIPIAELPEELKDGREVLVGGEWYGKWSATVAEWSSWGEWQLAHVGSFAGDGDLPGEPTHFAEITPPAKVER